MVQTYTYSDSPDNVIHKLISYLPIFNSKRIVFQSNYRVDFKLSQDFQTMYLNSEFVLIFPFKTYLRSERFQCRSKTDRYKLFFLKKWGKFWHQEMQKDFFLLADELSQKCVVASKYLLVQKSLSRF
jgi:hypothetical protein